MLCLPSLAYHLLCFSSFWDLATLTKIKSQMRNYRTKFGARTCLFEPLGRYLCRWMICSSLVYHQFSYQCFIADADTLVLMSVVRYSFKINFYTTECSIYKF